MTYIGIALGGVAGFLYWKFVGCTSGACPLTSNKFIAIAYGAVLGSLLLSTIAGSTPKSGFMSRLFGGDSAVNHTNITVEEFAVMAEDENTVVIDVRTPSEWKAGYLPGTDLFIDYGSGEFENEIQSLDRSKNYVLYCRSGNRSEKASRIMTKSGFAKVNNLSGGILKWTGELIKK